MAFEMIKRLQAIIAAVMRFAGGRAKLAYPRGVVRMTSRALYGFFFGKKDRKSVV